MGKKYVLLLGVLLHAASWHCFAQPVRTDGQHVQAGGDGWSSVKKNDYRKAKEEFTAALVKDSTDLQALGGMIFLSETSGDEYSYFKYINTLINNHWDENTYLLFSNAYKGKAGNIVLQNALSQRAKIDAQLDLADRDFFHRDFASAQKTYDKLFGNYQWTYIGPFRNLEGSGYENVFDVEREKYDAAKTYIDDDGSKWTWVNPPQRDNSRPVSFSDFLSTRGSAVYFANLFITVPSDRPVQLCLARKKPVKLWVDDDLVYSNRDNTSLEWDNEIVQLDLQQGTHRILVKFADYDPDSKPGGMFDYDPDEFSLENVSSGFQHRSNDEDGDFQLRITDRDGNLMSDITTSANGSYSSKKYKAEVSGFFVLEHFRQLIQKDPADLFNYFALGKAYEKYGMTAQGEETLVRFLQQNHDLVLAKYLAYKIYSKNNKKERSYEVMSGIDQSRTPIFEILYRHLQEIDRNNDEEKYFNALNNLSEISPSSMRVIHSYISYYDRKGQVEEKENYIRKMIRKYPSYEQDLKPELKQELSEKNKEQKKNFEQEQKRSYGKDLKRIRRDVKDYYYSQDYYDLIDHYKSKGDMLHVLSVYDEMINIKPYFTDYRYEKAKYLNEQERYDGCIDEMRTALSFQPYKADYLELMGDAFYGRNEKDSALKYYELAALQSTRSSIDLKIEKIQGPKQYKKLFSTPSFNDILAKEDWKEKYKDEESVVLMYTKDQVITPDNQTEIYQKMMVKILTDGGTKKWIEYDFGFMGNLKSARIIKKNGAEVIPDGRGGYKVFKNLEAGDIIELEGASAYSIALNAITNEYYNRTYMNFDAPVYYEKYEVAVPEGRYLGYMHHKLEDNLEKSNQKGFDMYDWKYHNVPGLAFEDAAVDKMDKWASIMISTMPDWSRIVKWYGNKTYRKLEAGYEVKEILDSIIKPGMSQQQKVETIYNYLTREIKYSYVTFLQSGYVPKDPGQTLCSRLGDCKDVATLMITMLRQVGVESYYVLVKTNDYFHQEVLPSLYFNHAIAGYYIDGKLHFLDMTTDFYPYYILPTMDANAWALLIKDGEKDLIRLPSDNLDSSKNKTEINVNAKLNTDRSADISVTAVHPGSTGGNIREYLTQSNRDEQKNFIVKLMGKGVFDNLNIIDYKFDNLEEISAPLRSNYNMNAYNYCDHVASMLVFRVPYMTPITTNDALLTKTRVNELDLEDVVDIEPSLQKVDIIFPAGYELLEMPKDVKVESKYGTYSVTFKKTKTGLHVEKFQSFKMSVVPVKEFEAFKKYYQEILDIDSSKIALRKKN